MGELCRRLKFLRYGGGGLVLTCVPAKLFMIGLATAARQGMESHNPMVGEADASAAAIPGPDGAYGGIPNVRPARH